VNFLFFAQFHQITAFYGQRYILRGSAVKNSRY